MNDQSQLTQAQRSSDWYEARLGKVTASKVGDVMAKGAKGQELQARKNYRENIVAERLTGIMADPEPYLSYDMKWGMANETIARNLYQMEYKRLVEDAPFVEHPELLAGASPDGYVTDMETGEIGLIEIKCLRSANHLYKAILKQEVPEEHIPQIQMQMWITGRAWCDFIAFDSRVPVGLQIFVKRVERDEEYIANMEVEVRKFLDECDNDFKRFWAQVKDKKKVNDVVGNILKKAEAKTA